MNYSYFRSHSGSIGTSDGSTDGDTTAQHRKDSFLDKFITSQPAETVPPYIPPQSDHDNAEMDLASFLIKRSCKNSTLANYFYW